MNDIFYYVDVSKKDNQILIRPFGFNHIGLLQPLYIFDVVNSLITDLTFGELILKHLDMSKNATKLNLIYKNDNYDTESKTSEISKFNQDVLRVSITYFPNKNKYHIIKHYAKKTNQYSYEQEDPHHIISGLISKKELGMAVRKTFLDISHKGLIK